MMDIDRVHKAINRREYVRYAERRKAAMKNGYQLPVSLVVEFSRPFGMRTDVKHADVMTFMRTSGESWHTAGLGRPDLLDVLRKPR